MHHVNSSQVILHNDIKQEQMKFCIWQNQKKSDTFSRVIVKSRDCNCLLNGATFYVCACFFLFKTLFYVTGSM